MPLVRRTDAIVEKRLSPRERHEAEAIARLRAEGALLRAVRDTLGGRVLPRLVEVGDDANGPFVRLERIPWPTLAERIDAAGGPLPDAFVAQAFAGALAALAEVHEARDASGSLDLVHADPSPANTVVSDDGAKVALLDLDLAVWRDAPARDGAFRGTVAYAAPEVARGEIPTPRADLFALAATFLHAATGEPPRRAASYAALLARAAEVPVLEPGAATALAARGPAFAVLVACLAFDPEARPASAREALARALC